jgi:transformation/transcription domain-associated protein
MYLGKDLAFNRIDSSLIRLTRRSTWRHRLPNDYDETSDWDDIVNWRTQIFNLITANFQWSEASALSALHDRPWTIIRMASAARKQGAKEFAILTLSKISDSSMDVADAFSKLREQILSLYNTDSDLERSGGLNLINTTNLGFFDSSQKSELFRLKAQFLSSLGGRSKANQAFCHAVQVCPTYAKAWISWGGLCSSLGRLAEKQQMEQQVDSETKENPNAKKVAQYLAQAMGCYLEAVNCDSNESSRMHLPKCLWMLVKDGNAPGVLSQTLESRGSLLPCWVWLPWCPQLLTSLYRVEGKATKAILINLAKTYPQALYFPLRSFYLERRDVERSKNSMSSSSQQSSVVHSEELMSFLRRAHATLWSSLEAILEELIVNFRPSYEEELLATISALLERADSQLEISSFTGKDSPDEEEIVAASIAKTLGRIATKFFRESTVDVAPSKRDERSRKTEAFKAKYKTKFEEDFLCLAVSDDKKERVDLEEFLKRLRTWKKMLEKQVSSTPHLFPLIESSQSLAMFSAEAPDLWPMSCDPKSAKKLIERDRTIEDIQSATTTTTSALAAQSAAITAAIAIAHAAAIEGQGGEYGGGSSSIEIPGQYVPNTTSAVDSKPAPELHAKLLRFEPRIRIVARNEQLIRCIGMLGSDGRSHHFLLQFAIPYWTRTDERTVQLCYVFEKLFRRDTMCCRNFLSIQPAPVIPIAQRLRITAENKGRISLDDIFRSRCDELGCETNVIVRYFRYKVKKLLSTRINQASSPEETKRLIYQTNIDVLREVCEKHVDNEILLNYITGRLGSAEKLFQFRRSFSSFLAVNSLMQHAFSVIVRTPSRVVINEFTGQVLSPEFRFCYNNQGLLENQKIPFRMTPNMRACLGPIMIDGRFIPSVTWAASAMKQNVEDIDSIFRLLLRDDIVAWYTSKSMAKSDTKTQELETQLADRVTKNVAIIISKISECSVQKESSVLDTLKSKLINDRVRELVDEASSMEKLSTMESNFQPWL